MIRHAGVCTVYDAKGKEIVFAGGKDSKVWDIEDKEYLDYILGFGPVIIGHGVKEVDDFVYNKMSEGIHFPSYSVHHEELIERLIDDDKACAFFKTSSESVLASIRIAMARTGRKKIIRCGYIGWHDVELANSPSWHEDINVPARYRNRYFGCYRGVDGEEAVLNWYSMQLNELNNLIEDNRDSICAIIIDAYQLVFTTIEQLRMAIMICHRHGIIVVLDETKTACRVAKLGCSELYHLPYDLLVIGKAIGNGAPLSLLIGDNELMSLCKKVRVTGTFSKESLSVYYALATLEYIQQHDGFSRIKSGVSNIVSTFNQAAQDEGVRHLVWCESLLNGTLFRVTFCSELNIEKSVRENCIRWMTSNGILLLDVHPSFVCTKHDEVPQSLIYDRVIKGLREWKISNEVFLDAIN